ncbi:hypothetical protein BKA62DRAFT_717422 [Auriculariales sp. MPI-PUGE-AT-0066]|nr:hypothetical protein BKA62DRAFT_717422 [Auriculariales sp. MPI-PUGE-AT-0066]
MRFTSSIFIISALLAGSAQATSAPSKAATLLHEIALGGKLSAAVEPAPVVPGGGAHKENTQITRRSPIDRASEVTEHQHDQIDISTDVLAGVDVNPDTSSCYDTCLAAIPQDETIGIDKACGAVSDDLQFEACMCSQGGTVPAIQACHDKCLPKDTTLPDAANPQARCNQVVQNAVSFRAHHSYGSNGVVTQRISLSTLAGFGAAALAILL